MTALLVVLAATALIGGLVAYTLRHLDRIAIWLDDDHDREDER